MKRYPNLKEEVGGSIPGCEISSPLDTNLALACQPSVSKKKKKKRKERRLQYILNSAPLLTNLSGGI